MRKKLSDNTDMRTAVLRAQDLVRAAIEELDKAGAPADIAAHLDTALHCLVRAVPNGGVNKSL